MGDPMPARLHKTRAPPKYSLAYGFFKDAQWLAAPQNKTELLDYRHYGQLQVLVRPLVNCSNWFAQVEIVVHARLNQRMRFTQIKVTPRRQMLNQRV
jgi:hypothetical protein